MLRFARSRDGRVALGLLTDGFEVAQVLREVERAYRMGDLVPGIDSVVVYEPGVDLSGISVADLATVRDCVAHHERSRPDDTHPYRGVIVAAEREALIVSSVYSATWQGSAEPPPRHDIVGSICAAERLLGCGPLADQIADLRPTPGLRYLG